jgi:hypothetical protein
MWRLKADATWIFGWHKLEREGAAKVENDTLSYDRNR